MVLTRVLLSSLFVSALYAQLVNTTSIVGNVADSSGAAVAGVSIVAINTATQETLRATTNNDGYYALQFVKIGSYDVTATQPGFQTMTTNGVQVDANLTVRTNFTLSVGQVSEKIVVTASTPPIATDNASIKEVVSQKSIADLPLNGRDPLQLAITTPGVIQGQKSASGTPPGEDFIGAGTREIQNSISLDGISMVNNLITTTPFHPSVDAIQEMEVQTGTYTAQYGAYMGVHLNLLTKTGGNQLHGAVYEFLRNDKMDARPYFLKSTAAKPPLRQNQFGFEVSGPVIIPKLYDGRNKTFFMANYEGLRIVRSSATLATTLTDAMRTGNFSELLPKQLTYPGTKTPIPGNIIPSTQISPQALNILQWLPAANGSGVTSNVSAVYPNNDRWNQSIDRVDQNFGDKTRIFFRYAWIKENILLGAANPYQATTTPVTTRNWVIGWTQTITPNMVNDIHFGRQTLDTNSLNYWYVNNLKDAGAKLGIPGFNADTATSNPGLPVISITNYLGTGSGSTNWFQGDTTWQGTDSLTWTHGAHSINAGLEFRKLITGRQAVNNTLGSFNFTGTYTGDAAADFLFGVANSDTTPAPQVRNIVAEWRDGFWVTDNWRATKRLTLDIGLRYELPTVPYTVNGYATILNPSLTTILPSNPPQRGFGLTGPNHKSFAPRLGAAYRITDKTVFRAGAGIYYNPNQTNSFTFLSVNPPFAFTTGYNATAANPVVTLANPQPAGLGSSPSATPSIYTPAAKLPPQTMYQWSASLQQGVGANGAFDISYLGSHSIHLDRNYYINTPAPGPGNIQARRPNQSFGSIRVIQNDVVANYDGLTLEFRQRLSHGLTFSSHYTWSHTLDVTTDSNGGGTNMNPFNWRADYGSSNWDVRHRWVTSATYELPKLAGSRSIERFVLGGWQSNGIFIVQSGFPFNVTIPTDQANTSSGGSQRPNLVSTPTNNCGDDHLVNCINIAAFQLPTLYTYGNAGRNLMTGPGLHNLDFSLFKSFSIKERAQVQYRAEFFNLFNSPNFANPNAGLPSLTSGTFTYSSPGTFGNITSTSHDNRSIQMALKFVF